MATTQTGDTALTYACENGHTDVADLLLAFSSRLVIMKLILYLYILYNAMQIIIIKITTIYLL